MYAMVLFAYSSCLSAVTLSFLIIIIQLHTFLGTKASWLYRSNQLGAHFKYCQVQSHVQAAHESPFFVHLAMSSNSYRII